MDSLGRPLHIHLTAGNIHDVSEAPTLIAAAQGKSFIADKGYDSNAVVDAIQQQRMKVVIPAGRAPSSSANKPRPTRVPHDAIAAPAPDAADGRALAGRRSPGDFSIVPPPPAKAPLKVLFVASEVAPFRKTGGLADVAGALPRALARRGIDVRVVMPLYQGIRWNELERLEGAVPIPMYYGTTWAGVRMGRLPGTDVRVYFLEYNRFFDRPDLYGPSGQSYQDNLERFTLFSRGALELCNVLGWIPDVIHANDWQTALVPVYVNTVEWAKPLHGSATLFTIHNLAYQGNWEPGHPAANRISPTSRSSSASRPRAAARQSDIEKMRGAYPIRTSFFCVRENLFEWAMLCQACDLFTTPRKTAMNLLVSKALFRILVTLALVFMAACVSASNTTSSDGATSVSRGVNFNLDWKYQKGDATGADATAFDDSTWGYVDLPHSTEFVTPENPNAYTGLSWYRKHFAVDGALAGRKVFVEFEAAMQLADVWVNGTHKVQHQGGYAPFTIDVTSDVTYGGADNVIAVRLDGAPNAAWPPGNASPDFQYHGGLYRNVNMHVTNALHITDAVYANKVAGGGVFVTCPAVSANSATVNVATNVINESSTTKSATVLSEVLDTDGQVVGYATSTASIEPGADSSFNHDITVSNPRLWHPNTPNLYTLRSTVQDDKTQVDRMTTRIGIRRIEWTHAGGLSINGARFNAIGVNLHQETYGLGYAMPNQATYYEVKRIKEGGSNFIRGSHYPHSPAFYDACDALGVLVLDAQSGWQFYNDTDAFKSAAYQELRDMIRRDRNHPSIVAWEASLNESSFTDAWAQMAHSIVHEEYPGDQAYSGQWTLSRSDISLGASQANIRGSTDTRPIIIDEYGDWDYGAGARGGSTSRQAREAGDAAMLTQANNVQDSLGKNLALSWYSVGSYWDYADYGGFLYYGNTECGLVDMYRLPKHAYYFQQSQRDPDVSIAGVDSGPIVYIANQWTESSPTTVRVYSNCEQVSLYLNDQLVATQSPDTGTSLLHPPFNFAVGSFASGTLRADGLIGGAVRVSTTRKTPGSAAAIRLRPEATTLLADASDARLVFVDVVDANGTVVPTDTSTVTLGVSGAGSIVGPASIVMKGGQLAVWVRSTRTPGTINLTASCSGLTQASVELASLAVSGLPPLPAGR